MANANANMTSVTFQSNMPLYIPRLFAEHADESYIAGIFFQQGIGQVERIDLIAKEQNGLTFFEAFIHFSSWYDTYAARDLQQQILDPQVKAHIVHCQREVRPGVWKPAFWIVNECLNPETPAEREVKLLERRLADEEALADFDEFHLLRTIDNQARVINQLFTLVEQQANELRNQESSVLPEEPEYDWMDPDELRDTPEEEAELPLTGHEIASRLPDGPLSDFYKEATESLTPEWLALSDQDKLQYLDSELEELAQEKLQHLNYELEQLAGTVAGAVLDSTSYGSSQSSTGINQWCDDGIDSEYDEYESRGECPGCESGIDNDGAHCRPSDGEYYSGCYCMDSYESGLV